MHTTGISTKNGIHEGVNGVSNKDWAGLFAGPLGEELGWRGFLLPEFQKRFPNLKSAIII
ncbi:MAG TPA: hypothetical protein DHV86_01025, partial [Methylophilaceae bacterium]|nr:hypothetical protein [Methylophilaceae bacterium]